MCNTSRRRPPGAGSPGSWRDGQTGFPLAPASSHQDADNRRRASKLYGDYDGINVLPAFSTPTNGPGRTLFWRLQGQSAVLHGEDKLIVLSHRPPQLFQPRADFGERRDLAASEPEKLQELFQRLGEWGANLETAPLWHESPRWRRDSAQIYDTWAPRAEPR